MNPTNLTRRKAMALGASTALAFGATPVFAQEARPVLEMAMGAEDAPVTVIEYASMTCPHCATFHTNVFTKIKTNYIETGKVRFIHRDVYFDRYGLWASMVARCGGPERFFGITDILFNRQADWSRKEDPNEVVAALFAIGRQAGMNDAEIDACMQDQAWAEALVAEFQKNTQADDVQGTPSFIINGQKQGNMSYQAFSQLLDAEIGS